MPGVSRLILVASREFPRFSEGDIIELSDGRLLLAIARKVGNSDMAQGTLIGMFSRDRGLTWDETPHVIKSTWGDITDVMSVSFTRSPRGIHMFFLGRGPDKKRDTRIYQMLSTDEGKTWGEPRKISDQGYHIVNNARVVRTKTGRLIVPAAHVGGDIDRDYNNQHIFCLYSDDDGVSWKQSNTLALDNQPLMEPGVAQCADGSLYMTIRTKMLKTYEARSHDDGATWVELRESPLPAPAAPATVVRAPESDELWMLWCNNAKGDWKGRSPQVFAASRDHGKTWSEPRVFEDDPKGSFGYISFDVIDESVLLTYYDWRDRGQKGFQETSLRERIIPLAWFRGEAVPPVFEKVSVAPSTAPASQPSPAIIQNDKGTSIRFTATRDAVLRAESSDGEKFANEHRVIESRGVDEEFTGITVFRHRRFYLALFHVRRPASGAIQPEWAWSHDGESWTQTRIAAIALGNEGAFDSREVSPRELILGDEVVCSYLAGNKTARAALPLAPLDKWLDALPQP